MQNEDILTETSGAPLDNVENSSTPLDNEVNDNTPQKVNKKKKIILAVVILISLVLVVVGILFLVDYLKYCNYNNPKLIRLIDAKKKRPVVKLLGKDYEFIDWDDDGAGEETDGWYSYTNKTFGGILYEDISVETYLGESLCDINLVSHKITETQLQEIIDDFEKKLGNDYYQDNEPRLSYYDETTVLTNTYIWSSNNCKIRLAYGKTDKGTYHVIIDISNYYY